VCCDQSIIVNELLVKLFIFIPELDQFFLFISDVIDSIFKFAFKSGEQLAHSHESVTFPFLGLIRIVNAFETNFHNGNQTLDC